jgi:hypothetical protein
VYVPLRVGDILKFGQSSRLYVFQGPAELMPEEGLSRAEKQQLKQLEAIQVSGPPVALANGTLRGCSAGWTLVAMPAREGGRGVFLKENPTMLDHRHVLVVCLGLVRA